MKRRTVGVALWLAAVCWTAAQRLPAVEEISWTALTPPVQTLLSKHGIDPAGFASYIADVRRRNQARVREGDLDHLVYYALQSTSFTRLPPIEPALSAKTFVGSGRVPREVVARLESLAKAMGRDTRDVRLGYFRQVLAAERLPSASIPQFLIDQYARAMRFLYEKEFVAAAREDEREATGRLYQERGLSTDTSVEASYLVYLAVATLRELEPKRRVDRVLVVGPGLDLAPRTSYVEAGDPQSVQPFAIIDALFSVGLADRTRMRLTAVDINPRVTGWLQRARDTSPRITLVTGVAEDRRVRFTEDYRTYFAALGRAIGTEHQLRPAINGHLAKTVQVTASVGSAMTAVTADIVAERLDDRFDLIVVTNVFPYLSDAELLLALTNIAGMLAPGGVLVHNEARPLVAEAILALGLSLVHSRTAVIATVAGGRAPLYDAIWIHQRQ